MGNILDINILTKNDSLLALGIVWGSHINHIFLVLNKKYAILLIKLHLSLSYQTQENKRILKVVAAGEKTIKAIYHGAWIRRFLYKYYKKDVY